MLPAFIFYFVLFCLLFLFPAGLLYLVLLFLEHERQLWRRIAPEVDPLARWLARRGGLDALRMHFPRATRALLHRLTLRDPFGLPATVTLLLIGIGAWALLRVLRGLASGDPLAILDLRLHNAVPLFRTSDITRFMLFITELGSPVTLALLCCGFALLALSRKKARLAASFVLAIGASSLISVVLKALVHSPRPSDAIVTAHEASFPSGHFLTAVVVYGWIAGLLLGGRLRDGMRAVAAPLLMILVGLIGLSRLYLGVHWPSDLLGSLAVALMVLSALFFFYYAKPIAWLDTFQLPEGRGAARVAGYGALVLTLIAPMVLYGRTTLLPGASPAPNKALESLSSALPAALSPWSEDLTGGRMEPVSMVLVGSADQLNEAFAHAGWTRADPPTPVLLLKEGIAALRNDPDPSGPATPAFFMNQPQSYTFEKPDLGAPTIRRRHHARVWRTDACLNPDCRPVWVATASFDVGMELSKPLHLPTHRIDPAIDHERAFVAGELGKVGATRDGMLAIAGPQRNKNAAGDPFWTDGNAVVMRMP
ncbi:LssY C-terminal domain-containing protein [Massilia sp. R2A-15]|uniref:LssY C-terminal domain-containing protein n=1 Tax=Massilia sp. R2A-15 TaxID=3064278 RepID=UPI002736D39D|nr:LssY C-terminal domain-containing protein [Massilia sp. R2A-15]WLI91131.1 LssY C-terminal domain-containing protein [Massilia sp. R2A-15]